jgi:hypothetical protein
MRPPRPQPFSVKRSAGFVSAHVWRDANLLTIAAMTLSTDEASRLLKWLTRAVKNMEARK